MFRADFYAVVAQVVPVLMLALFIERSSLFARLPHGPRPKRRRHELVLRWAVPFWATNAIFAEVLALVTLYRQESNSLIDLFIVVFLGNLLLLALADVFLRHHLEFRRARRRWERDEEDND